MNCASVSGSILKDFKAGLGSIGSHLLFLQFLFPTNFCYRGCVTGKQLQHVRENLEVPGQPGTYDFDRLDGFDSPGEKNSLNNHPDLQEKVRRVIIQGFIDPEDFNGVSALSFEQSRGALSYSVSNNRHCSRWLEQFSIIQTISQNASQLSQILRTISEIGRTMLI